MSRVKRGVTAHARHRKVLAKAKARPPVIRKRKPRVQVKTPRTVADVLPARDEAHKPPKVKAKTKAKAPTTSPTSKS